MKKIILLEVPTDVQLNNAIRRKDALILAGFQGEIYSFVFGPIDTLIPDKLSGRTGRYFLIDDQDELTDTRGDGLISFHDLNTHEPLAILYLLS